MEKGFDIRSDTTRSPAMYTTFSPRPADWGAWDTSGLTPRGRPRCTPHHPLPEACQGGGGRGGKRGEDASGPTPRGRPR
eukprot:837660-Prorocentrum_minimum.AAC.1